MRIEVIKEQDALNRERFGFYLTDNLTLYLSEYAVETMETKRHKFKPVSGYDRHNSRRYYAINTLSIESIEVPDSVLEQVKLEIMKSIRWNGECLK